MSRNTINIFLIEDDQIEILKFKRVMSELDDEDSIDFAENGEEAIDLLFGPKKIIPELILLDLNMPLFNGKEFLSRIKADENLKYIPVVILTTSENTSDIKYCYEQGIAGYFIKPLEYDTYVDIIHNIIRYWTLNQFASGR